MLKQMECKSKQFKSIPTEKMPTLWAMDKYLTFYLEQLTPLIQEVATQPMDGMHDLNTHTISVVARGIDCALHIDVEDDAGISDGNNMLYALLLYNRHLKEESLQKYCDTHVLPYSNLDYISGLNSNFSSEYYN